MISTASVESSWWPFVFLGGLVCSLAFLLAVLWQWWRATPLCRARLAYVAGAALLVGIASVDLLQSRLWGFAGSYQAIFQTVAVLSLGTLVLGANYLARQPQSGGWVRCGMLLFFLVATAYSSTRTLVASIPATYTPEENNIPGFTSPSRRFIGITDRGREVTLLRWAPKSNQDVQTISRLLAQMLAKASRVIPRADANTRSNCHGWVFTNGRYLLDAAGVARILADNGYEQVREPRADDIVIYRTSSGEILHTGLVRGVLDDGTVLIESKWSVGGRYLHLPDDQPYSQLYEYYRTSRPSHVVAIRFRNAEASDEDGVTRSVSLDVTPAAGGKL